MKDPNTAAGRRVVTYLRSGGDPSPSAVAKATRVDRKTARKWLDWHKANPVGKSPSPSGEPTEGNSPARDLDEDFDVPPPKTPETPPAGGEVTGDDDEDDDVDGFRVYL